MAEHTPFPWKARPTARRSSKSGMVDVRGGKHGGFVVANYVREEDAAVMEAVEDLLAAAKRAKRYLDKWTAYANLEEDPTEGVRGALERAIAKTEGRKPSYGGIAPFSERGG